VPAEGAGGDTLEVEDQDQHLEALRPARVGRQNRRRKADALGTVAAAVTHARAAHGDRAYASHDLALGQVPVAHQPLATVVGQLVGMRAEQGCNLGLDGLHQQRSRTVAQNLSQRISKTSNSLHTIDMNNPAPGRVRVWPCMRANPETRDLANPAAPGAHQGIPRGLHLSSSANAHEIVWRQGEVPLTAKIKSFACFY
jgi:hypothetical protein